MTQDNGGAGRLRCRVITTLMRCKNANVFVCAPASFCGAPRRRLWRMIHAMLLLVHRMVTCGRGGHAENTSPLLCGPENRATHKWFQQFFFFLMQPWMLFKNERISSGIPHSWPEVATRLFKDGGILSLLRFLRLFSQIKVWILQPSALNKSSVWMEVIKMIHKAIRQPYCILCTVQALWFH